MDSNGAWNSSGIGDPIGKVKCQANAEWEMTVERKKRKCGGWWVAGVKV